MLGTFHLVLFWEKEQHNHLAPQYVMESLPPRWVYGYSRQLHPSKALNGGMKFLHNNDQILTN